MPRSFADLVVLLPFTALLAGGCGGLSSGGLSGAGPNDTAVGDTKPHDLGLIGADVDDVGVADGEPDTGGTDTAVLDTTVAPVGPAPVLLGLAGDFVMLAEAAISTAPASIITGDLGMSPAAATFVTGFSMTRAGTYWTASQVLGRIYAADNDPPTPALLTTAIANMHTAYTDAAGRSTPDYLNVGVGAIGGLTLTPGLYRWTSSVTLASDLTISGGASDTWIFQITGDLTESLTQHVKLLGGAKAHNIVWQVAGMVTLGTSSHFEGIVLGKTVITLQTGASINGKLFSQTAINIDSSTVTLPSP